MALSYCLRSCKIKSAAIRNNAVHLSTRTFGQPAAQTHPHLLIEGDVTPGISRDEYRSRRLRFLERIIQASSERNTHPSFVIFPSAPRVYMTHDIPYPFRQNTDFLYLTGFLEPNSILVLEIGTKVSDCVSTLFVPKRDALRELWDGPRSGADGAVFITGIDQAFDMDRFDSYMNNRTSSLKSANIWYERENPAHREFNTKYINRLLEGREIRSPRQIVQSLRLIKSPAEVSLMRQSCQIASKAFIEVMKYSHVNVNESGLYAKMDYECRIQGAEYLAYPPVVSGGNRANTIHYISNNQLINDFDLVLMDAGCELHGYASDITRTWPVNGRFTPPQRELYEALLEVQTRCIALCVETQVFSLEKLYMEMLEMLGRQLMRLRIVSDGTEESQLKMIARQFCPHHVGHYLGMDVHDTDEIPRSTTFNPGMTITVEPGIYIPLNTQLQVPNEFRGLGMRIEDNVLITSSDQPEVLTSCCPKDPNELERLRK